MGSVLEIITPRRLVTTAVLILAAVVIIVGFQRTNTTDTIPCAQPNGPILKLLPCPGDTDLNQGVVGVDMAPGWQVDLTLDGTAIPKDQVTTEGSSYSYEPSPALRPGLHSAQVV